jgi:hypothetical protein
LCEAAEHPAQIVARAMRGFWRKSQCRAAIDLPPGKKKGARIAPRPLRLPAVPQDQNLKPAAMP